MRALILNGSPKRKASTSGLLGRAAGCLLWGCETRYASLRDPKEYPAILRQLRDIDALVLAVPLYVDGIPSHVLEFLQQAERFCLENSCRFTLYVISNNGFIEGIHNRVHLKMYACWCQHAAVDWGGGIGIGGGEMLHALSVYFPAIFAVMLAVNLFRYASGAPAALADWTPLFKNLAVYLFLHCGVIYCMVRLAASMRRLRKTDNRYTRVMVPSFVYVLLADIFMALTALFHGKNIFALLGKDPYARHADTGPGRKSAFRKH